MSQTLPMLGRSRRNRQGPAWRSLVRETTLSPSDLILPLFVCAGEGQRQPVEAMPGVVRASIDEVCAQAAVAWDLGIPAVALFPVIPDALKDPLASEASNPDGLLPDCVRALRRQLPDLVVITDVAMDPYSSDGHDGVVVDGCIDNDATLPILARMAVMQASAGAQMVAPSDMMDGRVGHIRRALDEAGYHQVGIISYCAKYASAFYGPFRQALDSQPRSGDKKTYQMDPANVREASRELAQDVAEGADVVMVKPGLPYLDVIARLRAETDLPVAAYHVSGEYAMLHAAASKGWLDYESCLLESLLCLRRAGADMIFTYGACDAARLLKSARR
ncbi:MAG: porphobilinogen synthase [Planctomycetota bacterium]|nr:MAG: porphobilinogen synthase [Planctomycetota bacterium]